MDPGCVRPSGAARGADHGLSPTPSEASDSSRGELRQHDGLECQRAGAAPNGSDDEPSWFADRERQARATATGRKDRVVQDENAGGRWVGDQEDPLQGRVPRTASEPIADRRRVATGQEVPGRTLDDKAVLVELR